MSSVLKRHQTSANPLNVSPDDGVAEGRIAGPLCSCSPEPADKKNKTKLKQQKKKQNPPQPLNGNLVLFWLANGTTWGARLHLAQQGGHWPSSPFSEALVRAALICLPRTVAGSCPGSSSPAPPPSPRRTPLCGIPL